MKYILLWFLALTIVACGSDDNKGTQEQEAPTAEQLSKLEIQKKTEVLTQTSWCNNSYIFDPGPSCDDMEFSIKYTITKLTENELYVEASIPNAYKALCDAVGPNGPVGKRRFSFRSELLDILKQESFRVKILSADAAEFTNLNGEKLVQNIIVTDELITLLPQDSALPPLNLEPCE